MTSRRRFLAVGSLTALVASLLPVKLLLNWRGRTPLEDLNLTQFAGLVNSQFTVNASQPDSTTLKLVSVRAIDADRQGKSFSLRLTAPAGNALPQRIHELHHDEIGTFAVFMVPHHAERGIQHYEVIFNRSV